MNIIPKFFIGPMTKNVVDGIIEFYNITRQSIAIIPSRRQIENIGGYVNNWCTTDFVSYIKNNTNNSILIQRDHSGPMQGEMADDGYESLSIDAVCMDLIHIDPWKSFQKYEDGLQWTINMIKYCYNINKNLLYEIGTEETIRHFTTSELQRFIKDLKSNLPIQIFNKIKYLVIQSGTCLYGNTQIGNFEPNRLMEMILLAKKYNLLTKEHNGDYIEKNIVKEKFNMGLDSINIAPEFGLIETQTYLDYIYNEKLLDDFWQICYTSNKWQKWVDADFDPIKNKIELIKICGHYVISTPKFFGFKQNFSYIDIEIKNRVIKRLKYLYE